MTTRLLLGPVDTATAAQVTAIAAAAHRVDGVAPLGEQAMFSLGSSRPEIAEFVAMTTGATVAGYAQIDYGLEPPVAELVVAPESRRAGIGGMLVRTILRDASLPRFSGEPTARPPLRIWAHGDLPAARQLASSLDLHAVRELWLMSRPLAPLTSASGQNPRGTGAAATTADGAADPASGVTLAPFRPGIDEPAWLALNREAFAWHPEQGRMDGDDLAERMAQPWFDPALLLLAWGPGPTPGSDPALLGSAWLKAEPGSDAIELYALAVSPSAQGSGIGTTLLNAAIATATATGRATMDLYTEADNQAAVALYRKAGFAVTNRDVQFAKQGDS